MPQPAPSPATSDLQAALQAEREAVVCLREMRDRVATAVAALVDGGMSYDRLACLTIRARTGQAPSLRERNREADRLRQIAHRHRVTSRHDFRFRKFENGMSDRARSWVQEDKNMEKLIKRTTITETFLANGAGRHPVPEDMDEHDEVEVDDDADEKDDEPPRATRPRR